MPYPLIHCPTWAEMRSNLIQNYGIEEYTVPTIPGHVFLRRRVGTHVIELPWECEYRDDETLSVSAIRELCDYLHLPKSKFGWSMADDVDAL